MKSSLEQRFEKTAGLPAALRDAAKTPGAHTSRYARNLISASQEGRDAARQIALEKKHPFISLGGDLFKALARSLFGKKTTLHRAKGGYNKGSTFAKARGRKAKALAKKALEPKPNNPKIP